MKIAVVRRNDSISSQLGEEFCRLANSCGLEEDEEHPDLVVSIGGDGTMLQAFHQYVNRLDQVAFVGVHTGHLGFFADWMPAELQQLVDFIRRVPQEGIPAVHYPLVEVTVRYVDGSRETRLALNEFSLKSKGSTLVARIDINEEPFEMFRGDGMCVSTPIGSTAYNKSLGGAVIHPSLEAIQVTEIASINNRVFRTLGSPIILPKHHRCEIVPKDNSGLILSIDHEHVERDDVASILCQVAKQKIRFARFRPFPFWTRVKEAFIGHDVQ